MSLKIETTIICDGCGVTTGESSKHLPGMSQRSRATALDGWQYTNGVDYCPACRPVKKAGGYPKKHFERSKRRTTNLKYIYKPENIIA